ncbi:MAG: PilZ domain-containing protein [Pseudomonadota bacterium]
MGAERRNHIRFLAQDNVIVAFRNGNIKIGKVKDISKGGLSFEHIYEEDLSEEVSKKEIVLWAEELRISDIPCRAIYDVPIPTPDEIQSFTIHFKTRRCGVQFESLSEEQTAQLDLFLKTYTQERFS